MTKRGTLTGRLLFYDAESSKKGILCDKTELNHNLTILIIGLTDKCKIMDKET